MTENTNVNTTLSQLSKFTKIVADTGDLTQIKKYNSVDVTTNPSLVLKAMEQGADEFQNIKILLKERFGDISTLSENELEKCLIYFNILLSIDILKLISGRVSIEVPSHYSFDTANTVRVSEEIIKNFQDLGIDKERILIKIAATYEGIKAAEQLEKKGIHCNLTLIFSIYQAIMCADSGVSLISPFVGRISDWYQQHQSEEAQQKDFGVESVKSIYQYLKFYDYPIEVMGASFRNIHQILGLAGCDLLTISPALIEALGKETIDITEELSIEKAKALQVDKKTINEDIFRWNLNQDPMATEKLSQGIRQFHLDFEKQRTIIKEVIG